jgi:hypothetical protein
LHKAFKKRNLRKRLQMKRSTIWAFLIALGMLVYGALQLFLIDPAQIRLEIPVFIGIPIADHTSQIVLSFALTGALWFVCELFGVFSGTPPARSSFGALMLSSLLLSFLGTQTHDTVMYGLGVLLFILPVFIENPSEPPKITEIGTQESAQGKPRDVINWGMIEALIALIALVWAVLTHYGLLR